MALRNFILNNFKWKVIALVLAILVWFVIQIGGFKPQENPLSGFSSETFYRYPVLSLIKPEEARSFRLEPPTVNLRVRGNVNTLNKVANRIKVFVNLMDMPDAGGVKEVLIHAPEGVDVLKVDPPFVSVERVVKAP